MGAQPPLGLLGRETQKTALDIGRELGMSADASGLVDAIRAFVSAKPKDFTVQVTTSGKLSKPKVPGAREILTASARRDIIEFAGGQNAEQVRQLIAGYIQGGTAAKRTADVTREATAALHIALSDVLLGAAEKKRGVESRLTAFSRRVAEMEREALGRRQSLKLLNNNAEYIGLKDSISKCEAALKVLREVETKLANNLARLEGVQKPVIQDTAKLVATVARQLEAARPKTPVRFVPVAVATAVIGAVAAAYALTAGFPEKEEKKVPKKLDF